MNIQHCPWKENKRRIYQKCNGNFNQNYIKMCGLNPLCPPCKRNEGSQGHIGACPQVTHARVSVLRFPQPRGSVAARISARNRSKPPVHATKNNENWVTMCPKFSRTFLECSKNSSLTLFPIFALSFNSESEWFVSSTSPACSLTESVETSEPGKAVLKSRIHCRY